MPRADRRFTAFDHIRLFENNLPLADKRLVIAWFFSLIPVKEPEVDVLGIILELASLIPGGGLVGRIFQISIATAQAAADIADLFQFEPEEEEIEIGRLRLELQVLRDEFDQLRLERLETLRSLDQANERIEALLATQQLLEEEIAGFDALPDELKTQLRNNLAELDRQVKNIRDNLSFLPRNRFTNLIRFNANSIEREVLAMRRAINA